MLYGKNIELSKGLGIGRKVIAILAAFGNQRLHREEKYIIQTMSVLLSYLSIMGI